MERNLYHKLCDWKESAGRKPLVLTGARQTGKTYLLQEFGRRQFRATHYVNMQLNKSMHSIFDGNLDPGGLLRQLEFSLSAAIQTDADLLILDEIQDCPRALTSLKFFCEQVPQLAVCCAGSLLGVVHPKEPFPVGKVTFLHLHPLSYGEFIQARDATAFTAWSQITRRSAVPAVVHERLMSLLREYLVVGGMPEVVATCVAQPPAELRTFELVRRKQQDLLTAYMGDFSKYAEAVRSQEIVALFESIPSQLSRENKRFRSSLALAGSRFSRLKNALDWLVGAGIAHKVHVANSAELPFSAFTQENRFKLYLLDVGLLGALARLAPAALMAPPDLFATFRGAFCENLVAQEFVYATDAPLYAWASNTSEVEFLREVEGAVFPVEVKAGLSGKLKSLKVFADKYRPAYQVRISGRNLEINASSVLHSYPLYLAGRFPLPE